MEHIIDFFVIAGAELWADAAKREDIIVMVLGIVGILWLYIGILWILDRRRAYTHALGYLGMFCSPLNTESDEIALQVGVSFINTARGAIRYRVKSFHVVVGSTTIPLPEYENDGGVIPLGVARNYRFPPFKKEHLQPYFGKITTGVVDFIVEYGPTRGPLKHQLHMVVWLTYRFDQKDGGIADTIKTEEYC